MCRAHKDSAEEHALFPLKVFVRYVFFFVCKCFVHLKWLHTRKHFISAPHKGTERTKIVIMRSRQTRKQQTEISCTGGARRKEAVLLDGNFCAHHWTNAIKNWSKIKPRLSRERNGETFFFNAKTQNSIIVEGGIYSLEYERESVGKRIFAFSSCFPSLPLVPFDCFLYENRARGEIFFNPNFVPCENFISRRSSTSLSFTNLFRM